jgi:hypothetical protein
VAQVHVHVTSEKPRPHPARRVARWADRTALGMVMGALAFGLERAVLRGTKRARAADGR